MTVMPVHVKGLLVESTLLAPQSLVTHCHAYSLH